MTDQLWFVIYCKITKMIFIRGMIIMIKSQWRVAQVNNSYSKKLNTLLAIAVSIMALTMSGYAHAVPGASGSAGVGMGASTNAGASANESGIE
jgi:hypothetical protein